MEVMKKVIKNLYKIMFSVSLSVLTIGCCSAKDFFTNLDFKQQDNNQPVPISENEIFFQGEVIIKHQNVIILQNL